MRLVERNSAFRGSLVRVFAIARGGEGYDSFRYTGNASFGIPGFFCVPSPFYFVVVRRV